MKKAYLVTITSWRGLSMVYGAQTPGKAKGLSFYNAHDAGYDVPYADFRAKRAPKFDYLAQETKTPWLCLGWYDNGETWGCLKKPA